MSDLDLIADYTCAMPDETAALMAKLGFDRASNDDIDKFFAYVDKRGAEWLISELTSCAPASDPA